MMRRDKGKVGRKGEGKVEDRKCYLILGIGFLPMANCSRFVCALLIPELSIEICQKLNHH